MPKKIKFLATIAVFFLLIVFIVKLMIENNGFYSTEMNFAVEDTKKISKIFLANKSGFSVTLNRKYDTWYVNDKYEVRKDAINNLLTLLKRIKVRAPVPKSAKENILRLLSYEAIKVEVYLENDKKPHKVFYIGGSSPAKDGSYAILENAQNPYLVYMEGHYGFLTPFFMVEEHLWRDRKIWKYKYYEILSLTVEYPLSPENSFEIVQKPEKEIEVISLASGKPITSIDTMKTYRYLALFNNLEFDYLLPYTQDSIIPILTKTTPFMRIKIIDNFGKVSSLALYKKPPSENQTTFIGEPPSQDIYGAYGLINDTTLSIVQYVMIDKIKWTIYDFQLMKKQ